MATPKTYITNIDLDHNSPIPLYHQISEPIKELILNGTIPAGAKLEDELSMASRLGSFPPYRPSRSANLGGFAPGGAQTRGWHYSCPQGNSSTS